MGSTFNVITGQVTTGNVESVTYNRGNIFFETIEPVSRAAVPEPSATIGLLAFGLLGLGQRKVFKRRRTSGLNNSYKNQI